MVLEAEHVVAAVALDLALPHRVVGPLNLEAFFLKHGALWARRL